MRTLPLVPLLLLLTAHTALAASSSANSSSSGTDETVWETRAQRAEGFSADWNNFAPVFISWVDKWEKYATKHASHLTRCSLDLRSANRDTLLPVTQLCYKGQLLIEQDLLKREREIMVLWPGIPEQARAEHLASIDALQGALTPIIDGIDARVFTTLTAFRDVRQNLLTQYRQPYWFTAVRLRAHTLHTWTALMLLRLHAFSAVPSLTPAALAKITEALACFSSAEPLLAATEDATDLTAARTAFSQVQEALADCPVLLQEAAILQQDAESAASPSR